MHLCMHIHALFSAISRHIDFVVTTTKKAETVLSFTLPLPTAPIPWPIICFLFSIILPFLECHIKQSSWYVFLNQKKITMLCWFECNFFKWLFTFSSIMPLRFIQVAACNTSLFHFITG